MKKQITNSVVVSSLFLAIAAQAAIDMPHVDGYDQAGLAVLWEKVKPDKVPQELVTRSTVDDPGSSYSKLFPKSFLQEEMFAVCYQDCKKKDSFSVKNGSVATDDQDGLEQSNVYFWLKRYFNFLEERFAFRPEHYLRVVTNRTIKDPTAGKKMRNNAFFNPEDISLSFLPATNGLLTNVLNGKINRSGYDASVISHEASHFLFFHLFPNPVNTEISGLNEGFADYIANIHLNNPKVGLIMLRGKTLRDASSIVDGQNKLKTYVPGLEVHDLGERVSTALWLTRDLVSDKSEYDRMVVDAVKDIAQNPYATVHSFKAAMLKRIATVLSSSKLSEAKAIWQMHLEGEEAVVSETSFLSKPSTGDGYLGFRINQTISKKFADEMGLEQHNNQGIIFIRDVKLANKQTAMLIASENETVTTPYWFVIDDKSGNVLAIYSLDKKLVTDPKELEEIKVLTDQVVSQTETIKEFVSKTIMFSDLLQGKGDLSSGYKVKSAQAFADSLSFNGEPLAIERMEIRLKKKFLINLLVGLPDIEKVTLYLANKNIGALPLVNGKRVIGYKMAFANGTSTEMILNKYAKQPE